MILKSEVNLIDIGYRPRPWQQAVSRALKRFSVLIVHRRGGKTVFAIATLVHAALFPKLEKSRFAYLAPFRTQAKAVAWEYLKSFALKVPDVKINESELRVDFPNGSQIRIYGADDPDSLRGIYLDGIVPDEVANMKPAVWGEVIRPALADRKGWALFIGTPQGLNLLSELYYAAQRDPEWYAAIYRVNDTNALDEKELSQAKKTMSENQYRQEMLCDFGASNENQLIKIDDVQEACERKIETGDYDFAPKIIGVDVARYGGDRSVIFRRQGLKAFEPIVYDSVDNMTLASRVAQEYDDWKADAIFVDAGRGEGVIDRLRQLKYAPIPVDFGGKPMNDRYRNKRAEIWSMMGEWINSGAQLPDHMALKNDLIGPTYSYANAANKLELESKDDMLKRGLRSTDVADALAVTFAAPVGIGRHRAAVASDAKKRLQTIKSHDEERSHVGPYRPLIGG